MVWTSLSSLLFTSKLAFKHRPYVVELFEMRYRFICWSYIIMSILCRGLPVYFVWKFVEFHFGSDSNFDSFYWLAATKHWTFNHYLILKIYCVFITSEWPKSPGPHHKLVHIKSVFSFQWVTWSTILVSH